MGKKASILPKQHPANSAGLHPASFFMGESWEQILGSGCMELTSQHLKCRFLRTALAANPRSWHHAEQLKHGFLDGGPASAAPFSF